MSSLLRRQLLRSESHFSPQASLLLTEELDSSSDDEADASLEDGLQHAATAPLLSHAAAREANAHQTGEPLVCMVVFD